MKGASEMSFTAQFRGRCSECGQEIEVGDRIGGISGEGYKHVTCPDEVQPRPTKFQGTTSEEMGF